MTHEILRPGYARRDARGEFLEVLNGVLFETFACGRMSPGAVMGNHYHKATRVFFYLLRGGAEVRTVHVETGERDGFALKENEGVFLEPGVSHAIRFTADSEFVMLKSRRYDPESPDTYPYPVV